MIFSAYILDNGLSYFNSNNVNMAICQTEPLVLADCTGLSGAGGKRVSSQKVITAGTITLANGVNANSRNIVVPVQTFQDDIQVAVSAGSADLWLVFYDGTRILAKSNTIADRELLLGATILTPQITAGVQQ